jgi:GNAT superfamily N-acetyltransferase
MRIRRATVADALRIAEIHVTSWQSAYRGIMPGTVLNALSVQKRADFWTAYLAEQVTNAFVLEDEGRVQGWIDFGNCSDADAKSDVEVYGIYLDPSIYRRGYGRMLWNEAQECFRRQSAKRIAVWVLDANTRARRFYEAMGGVLESGAVKQFCRDGVDMPALRYWCPVS